MQAAKYHKEHRPAGIKGPKQASAVQFVELRTLRAQLTALPQDLVEDARRGYMVQQNNTQKAMQDFQMDQLIKMEKILKNLSQKAFKIGGHPKGPYERFFALAPMQFMTKAGYLTAMRLAFGDELITSEGVLSKLYSSFDTRRVDEMDWRSFLFLLAVLMQPMLLGEGILRVGYALYCSVGSLDLAATIPVRWGELKRLMLVPCLLSYHATLSADLEASYQSLLLNDTSTLQYVSKQQQKIGGMDPEDVKLSWPIFLKVLLTEPFAAHMKPGSLYGKRDPRTWATTLEENYYHPTLLRYLKALRRYHRNEAACALFLSNRSQRSRAFHLSLWKAFVERRRLFRLLLIAVELRSTLTNYGSVLDSWKKVCIQHRHAVTVQRAYRGHLTRRRVAFMQRLRTKVGLLQKTSRAVAKKWQTDRKKVHLAWAAGTIQRIYRGRLARRRVSGLVEAIYDNAQRALIKRRREWMEGRFYRAAFALQCVVKKFLRRRRTMRRMAAQHADDRVKKDMLQHAADLKLADKLYMEKVSAWYRQRREEHLLDARNENETRQQKQLLIARRTAKARIEKERKAKEKAILEQKLEEERVELWIAQWEEVIKKRGEKRRIYCRNAMAMPEDPDQVKLRKEIQKAVQLHIKDVLRRADAMKIPMEIPQAQAQAKEEIIEMQVQAELLAAREDMRLDGQRIEEEKARKLKQIADQEAAEKLRKAKWAIITIQCYMRAFLARKRVRAEAYKRYQKHFDIGYHEYYYEDRLTHVTSWEKPVVLGTYDLAMDNFWVILHGRQGESGDGEGRAELFYYYNPSTWEQRWRQPKGTLLCQRCSSYFAQAYLQMENCYYCHACLAIQCNALCAVWSSQQIMLKLLNGGREDAQHTSLTAIPEISWFTHTAPVDASVKMNEVEEAVAFRSESMKMKARVGPQMCEICCTAVAEKHCEDCQMYYCRACCKSQHKKATRTMRYHFIVPLHSSLPVLPGVKKHKKHKKKKDKLSPLPIISTFPPIVPVSFPEPVHHEELEQSESDAPYDSEAGTGVTDSSLEKKTKKHKHRRRHKKHNDQGDDTDATDTGDESKAKKTKHKHKKKKNHRDRALSDDAGASGTEGTASTHEKRKKKKKKHKSAAATSDGDISGLSDYSSEAAPGTKKRKGKKSKANEDNVDKLPTIASAQRFEMNELV